MSEAKLAWDLIFVVDNRQFQMFQLQKHFMMSETRRRSRIIGPKSI